MVRKDPSMLEGFSKAEERKMVDDLESKRKLKSSGVRASNKAASLDASRTVERLAAEVSTYSVPTECLQVLIFP